MRGDRKLALYLFILVVYGFASVPLYLHTFTTDDYRGYIAIVVLTACVFKLRKVLAD